MREIIIYYINNVVNVVVSSPFQTRFNEVSEFSKNILCKNANRYYGKGAYNNKNFTMLDGEIIL